MKIKSVGLGRASGRGVPNSLDTILKSNIFLTLKFDLVLIVG